MASQGQLWLQLSGAAIAFLEMFAYMVAPFALLMLLALGGNGVAAAAKYLQLILCEYVAAYGSNGQRVCEEVVMADCRS